MGCLNVQKQECPKGGYKATKQYISADLQGMHNCTLGFDSLGGGSNEPS